MILSVLLYSCKKESEAGCFDSTGDITTENRSIQTFNNIILNDNVNLILNKADSNSIIIEAGANIIKGIKTTVSETGVLDISNNNACNWIRSFESPINVYLNYIDIDSIEYKSIGDITTTNPLITDSLWITAHKGAGQINMDIDVSTLYCSLHYGTLDIILKGKSSISYVYSASFGLINMIDIESNFVYINNKSSNDVYIWAKTHLGATIENIGNIYYTGSPETISFDKIGTGELINIDNQ